MESTTILLWIAFTIIGTAIGHNKGRAGEGALLGFVLGPIGILIALCLKSQKELEERNTKECPHCAERVAVAAKLCKHCGQAVPIAFNCPSCKVGLLRPVDMPSGTRVKCERCSKPIVVP